MASDGAAESDLATEKPSDHEEEQEPASTAAGPQPQDVSTFEQADSELPPLPVDDASLLNGPEESAEGQSELVGDRTDAVGSTTMDEREMNKHLMDVESSFLPEASPAAQAGAQAGLDDTYVFGAESNDGGQHGSDQVEASQATSQDVSEEELGFRAIPEAIPEQPENPETATPASPPTPVGAYKTPAQGLSGNVTQDDVVQSVEDSSEMEHMPSSPSAAAAQRTHNKAATEKTAAGDEEEVNDSQEGASVEPFTTANGSLAEDDAPVTEHQPPSVDRPSTRESEHDFLAPLNDNIHIDTLSSRLRKRPSYLKTRQSSQRSSASSLTNKSDGDNFSDATLSVDYALQTGGALSAETPFISRSRTGLSRLPSLGSVASSTSGFGDITPTYDRFRTLGGGGSGGSGYFSSRNESRDLERLNEERAHSESAPTTPRADEFSTNGPTDTVIAQHVQNIQVPDTVAQAYRARHRSQSPEKRPASSGMASTLQSRNRSHLTLKEQNSKIDRLSKENFDLKLKIHFLDQALQNRSDEGIKEMISKNVQFQTDLANEKKENQSLRRKIRDLERKVKSQEDGLAEAKKQSNEFAEEPSVDPSQQTEMEEEITFLREQLVYSETQVEKLTEEKMGKEVENRRLAEYVRSMGERKTSEPSAGDEETIEMWKDLLQAETARREQADEDAQQCREEIAQLKEQIAAQSATNHTRYSHISRRYQHLSYPFSQSGDSETTSNQNGEAITSSSSTAVEQLKHENAELRRDLGAQTSMLTSRNRERERLQQEIEDLKLLQRRGDGVKSIAGDSIFERSVSRANQRPASRASGHTRISQLSDTEREEYDRKQNVLRDELAEQKLLNQDLERELNVHLDELSQMEEKLRTFEEEMQSATEDLQALQVERDDVLAALQEKEVECDELEKEAISTIDQLELQLRQRQREVEKTASSLANRNEDFRALQHELKQMSESVITLEDDRQASTRRIQALEQELDDANGELESQDKRLKESREKNERLEVATESHQGEISFLREEQEGDKIRIGELEDALNAAQQAVADEKERLHDMEQRLEEERKQREALDSQEKQEVQGVMDELNGQTSRAKEEVRKLRKNLSAKEVESSNYKQRLDELEEGLRTALGSPNGAGSGLLKIVHKVQKELADTAEALESHRHDLAERDRLLRSRDALLESTGLESRKLSDLLDTERAARRRERLLYENTARGHQAHRTTLAAHEARVLELETQKGVDKRKIAHLEERMREQLLERHNILLALWSRLSTICGAEWNRDHALIDGEPPSFEVLNKNLPGFSKNLILAVKTVESLIGAFRHRVRQIEKDLWRDFQTLEHALETRTKRLDSVETVVKNLVPNPNATLSPVRPAVPSRSSSRSGPSSSSRHTEEISKLKGEIKILKAELQFARQTSPTIPPMSPPRQRGGGGSSDSTGGPGPSHRSARDATARTVNTLLRHHSTSAVELLQQQQQQQQRQHQHHGSGDDAAIPHQSTGFPHVVPPANRARSLALPVPPTLQSPSTTASQQQQLQSQQGQQGPSEQRWIHRLKELERRLKAEREARLLDRSGARKRLEEGRAENEELRMLLEREKVRRGSVVSSVGGGSVVGRSEAGE
ncbi:MAG: Anucleate primary sterigmata protein B [Bathelium mastoideum]|nr:MAG: Anucleate primary sterigmata protein B [Bathelium mastoideum]